MSAASPAITIGLPVYNGAKHLDQALAALSTQSFADFVVVISDNASDDETPAIIDAWRGRDPRFVYHRQARNIGAAANFAYVLEQATSPFFMFAAYDDWWSPNYIEALHQAITASPRSAMAVPTIVQTREDGAEWRRVPFPELGSVRLMRIARALRCSQAGWYYGLFRTEELRPAYRRACDFGHVWAADHITMLPFLLADRLTGSREAVFNQRQTPLSVPRYKPKTLPEQSAFTWRFLIFCYDALAAAPLNPLLKLAVAPLLLPYVNAKAWKFRRLVRSAILAPFRRATAEARRAAP